MSRPKAFQFVLASRRKAQTGDVAMGPLSTKQDYDHSIHHNPDALAWAKFFKACMQDANVEEDVMVGWFANAMMAMHDHLKGKAKTMYAVYYPSGEFYAIRESESSAQFIASQTLAKNFVVRQVLVLE